MAHRPGSILLRDINRWLTLLPLWLVVVSCATAGAAEPKYPFSAQENRDGARFVWFIYQQAKKPYDYLPAATLHTSPRLQEVSRDFPVMGDIVCWKELAVIYDPEAPFRYNLSSDFRLVTAEGVLSLPVLEKRFGPPRWLRYAPQK